MTFWTTVTLKTYMILSYYRPACGATPILFHPKSIKADSLQKMEFISVKVNNDKYECPAEKVRN